METNKIKLLIGKNIKLIILLLVIFIVNYVFSHFFLLIKNLIIDKIYNVAGGLIKISELFYFEYILLTGYVILFSYIVNFLNLKINKSQNNIVYNIMLLLILGIIFLIVLNLLQIIDIKYISYYIYAIPFISILGLFLEIETNNNNNNLHNNNILEQVSNNIDKYVNIDKKIGAINISELDTGIDEKIENINNDNGIIDIDGLDDEIEKIKLGEDIKTKDLKDIISKEREKENELMKDEIDERGFIDIDYISNNDNELEKELDLLGNFDDNDDNNDNSFSINEEEIDEEFDLKYKIQDLYIKGFHTNHEIEQLKLLLTKI